VSENRPFSATEKTLWGAGVLLIVGVMVMFLMAPAWTQHPPVKPKPAMDMSHMDDMPDMPDMPGMQHAETVTPEQQRKYDKDKAESEFNHHLAGVLVFAAGVLFLLQGSIQKKWPGIRYAWPVCFLLGGFFLLLVSDTEIWPFGYQSFIYAVTHNREDAQHKTFALILLVLGAVEMLRASGRLKAAWSAWVFPVVGIFGAILLLFHEHGGMHGPDAMKTMFAVMHEHYAFAVVGVATCLAKGLSEVRANWGRIFAKVWPVCIMALGVLLVMYHE
jgi:copper resistance protein D